MRVLIYTIRGETAVGWVNSWDSWTRKSYRERVPRSIHRAQAEWVSARVGMAEGYILAVLMDDLFDYLPTRTIGGA